jgi:GNAT superfamily N-acetyltransferase
MTSVLPRPAQVGVEMRPVTPADHSAVRAFLAGLSLSSAYRRFFTGIGSPSSTLVRRLVEVDHDRRSALLALAGGEVVGLADTAIVDAATVELGVVIADRWQRRGLGPRLIAAALEPAIARGCTTLLAHTLPDNTRVARLVRRRWPGADPSWDGDCLVWTLPLGR